MVRKLTAYMTEILLGKGVKNETKKQTNKIVVLAFFTKQKIVERVIHISGFKQKELKHAVFVPRCLCLLSKSDKIHYDIMAHFRFFLHFENYFVIRSSNFSNLIFQRFQ
jgi:hypothetical protein